MKKLLPIFLMIALYGVSCKKTRVQPSPDLTIPTTHAKARHKIYGTISPVGSVSEIKLTGQIGGSYNTLSAEPDDQGRYTFTDMEQGEYNLSINTTYGFLAPANIRLSMPSSTDLNLSNIDLQAVRPLGTSSILGRISPAQAAYAVTLTGAKSTVTAIIDPLTGIFKALLLPEDTYTVSFQTGGKYLSPHTSEVQTQPGKVSDMGTLSFVQNVAVSSMSATVGNNNAIFRTYLNSGGNTGSITVSRNGSSLSVQGVHTTGAPGTAMGGSITRLGFSIGNFTGTGTYLCEKGAKNMVSYYYRNTRLSITPAIDCTSDLQDASATITVTAYDPIKKTISGTFSGTLKGNSALTGGVTSHVISNGSFDITL